MGRSGNLICKNDHLISELINDSNYEIRPDGTIWTRITMSGKPSVDNVWRLAGHARRGYWTMKYKNRMIQIHRIIYAKFKGSLEVDLVINHMDGNGYNNNPENLELVTQSKNNYHRYRRDETKSFPVMGRANLTWDIVRDIRQKHKDGMSYHDLCYTYDISKGHLSEIINNKIWIEGKKYAA